MMTGAGGSYLPASPVVVPDDQPDALPRAIPQERVRQGLSVGWHEPEQGECLAAVPSSVVDGFEYAACRRIKPITGHCDGHDRHAARAATGSPLLAASDGGKSHAVQMARTDLRKNRGKRQGFPAALNLSGDGSFHARLFWGRRLR